MPKRFAIGCVPALLTTLLLFACQAGGKPDAVGPLVIAHRGASGYLPEHTLAAYALAFGQGADIIEPDVVMTRDGVLVCAHDLTAEAVTDAASVYPGRARADGKWYFADLTSIEVKRLSKRGRSDRQPEGGLFTGYSVPTLEEMIQLVQELNRRTGRRVGIIPEPKSPKFHREVGLPIEAALVATLAKWGYVDIGADRGGATIQCFDLDALRTIRFELGCRLPLAFTVGNTLDPATLQQAAAFVQIIGPNRELIEPKPGAAAPAMDMLAFARSHHLAVYPWTFGDEPEATRRFFHHHGVEAVFIDFPDVGVRAK